MRIRVRFCGALFFLVALSIVTCGSALECFMDDGKWVDCGAKPGRFGTSNHTFSHKPGSERTNERSGAREQSEQGGASE